MKNNKKQEAVTSVKFFFDLRVFLIEVTDRIGEKKYYFTQIYKSHKAVNNALELTAEQWLKRTKLKRFTQQSEVFEMKLR